MAHPQQLLAPVKRSLVKLVLLLVLGAIINVAVAWGWVVWHPVADSVALVTWQWPRVDSTGWQMYSLPHWPQAKVVTRHDLGAVDGEAPGAALVALSHDPFSDDFAADSFTIMSVCWQDYGWPRLSLRATEWQEGERCMIRCACCGVWSAYNPPACGLVVTANAVTR